ncbi:MAG: DivIVA domain-containing protein [Clostridia bacterium]|jgi:cell division septum initiation protein DivIVA
MKKAFGKSLIGYSKQDVEEYIKYLKDDYEEELSRKRDRIIELNEEVRTLRDEMARLKEELEKYAGTEKCISQVLIKAQAKALMIEEEGRRKYNLEMEKIDQEKKKWDAERKSRIQLIKDLEDRAAHIIGIFLSDIRSLSEAEIVDTFDLEGEAALTREGDLCETIEEGSNIRTFDITREQYQGDQDLEEICRDLGFYKHND